MSPERDPTTATTQAAWDLTAQKFAPEVGGDVEFLQGGGMSLVERERQTLSRLPSRGRAIHLQCSHGLDSLSLLNLGMSEVVGIDLSEAMLELAEMKSARLGWAARWLHADVLDPPSELLGTADLVYTGKGAVPWVRDISSWAEVVRSLLRPGGFLYVYEGHPLDWIWDPEANHHRLHSERSYFDQEPRANEDFPARAAARFARPGEPVPAAWEYHWGLGEIVSAVVGAELEIVSLEEHGEHYWPRFERITGGEFDRVPHTFSMLARSRTA